MSDTLHKKPVNMNNYLLFAGDIFYPVGGWGDFIGSYSTPEEAKEAVESLAIINWWHIVDLETEEIVSVR